MTTRPSARSLASVADPVDRSDVRTPSNHSRQSIWSQLSSPPVVHKATYLPLDGPIDSDDLKEIEIRKVRDSIHEMSTLLDEMQSMRSASQSIARHSRQSSQAESLKGISEDFADFSEAPIPYIPRLPPSLPATLPASALHSSSSPTKGRRDSKVSFEEPLRVSPAHRRAPSTPAGFAPQLGSQLSSQLDKQSQPTRLPVRARPVSASAMRPAASFTDDSDATPRASIRVPTPPAISQDRETSSDDGYHTASEDSPRALRPTDPANFASFTSQPSPLRRELAYPSDTPTESGADSASTTSPQRNRGHAKSPPATALPATPVGPDPAIVTRKPLPTPPIDSPYSEADGKPQIALRSALRNSQSQNQEQNQEQSQMATPVATPPVAVPAPMPLKSALKRTSYDFPDDVFQVDEAELNTLAGTGTVGTQNLSEFPTPSVYSMELLPPDEDVRRALAQVAGDTHALSSSGSQPKGQDGRRSVSATEPSRDVRDGDGEEREHRKHRRHRSSEPGAERESRRRHREREREHRSRHSRTKSSPQDARDSARAGFTKRSIESLLNKDGGRSYDLDDIDLPASELKLLQKFVDALSKLSVEVQMDGAKRVEGRRRMHNALRALEGWI